MSKLLMPYVSFLWVLIGVGDGSQSPVMKVLKIMRNVRRRVVAASSGRRGLSSSEAAAGCHFRLYVFLRAPCFEYILGKMIVHEENILITDKGYELLSSRTPQNIPIIS